MCANIEAKNVEITKAGKDIVCFKYYTRSDNGELGSWFQGDKTYKENELYLDEIKFIKTKEETGAKDGAINKTATWKSKKGFHSAMSLSECIKMIEEKAHPSSTTSIVICKCKIPEGSHYVSASEEYARKKEYKLDTFVSENIFIEKVLMEVKGKDILQTSDKIIWAYDISPAW